MLFSIYTVRLVKSLFQFVLRQTNKPASQAAVSRLGGNSDPISHSYCMLLENITEFVDSGDGGRWMGRAIWTENGIDTRCPGWFWAAAASELPENLNLTLSDLSPGMVQEAVERCRPLSFASVTGLEFEKQQKI